MFYKQKYLQALQEIQELRNKEGKYISSYKAAINNINHLHKLFGTQIITSFCIETDVFCVVLECVIKMQPAFYIFNISSEFKTKQEAVAFCLANIIVEKRVDGIVHNNLFIQEIRAREHRKGFGSRIIQSVINYAKSIDCDTVYGNMKPDPDMSISALSQFYINNGFTIDGTHFYMDLSSC